MYQKDFAKGKLNLNRRTLQVGNHFFNSGSEPVSHRMSKVSKECEDSTDFHSASTQYVAYQLSKNINLKLK